MLAGDGQDRVHVDGQAVQVDDEDGFGLGGDRGLDLGHVDVHGVIVDVDKDGDAVVLLSVKLPRRPVCLAGDMVARERSVQAASHDPSGCGTIAGGQAYGCGFSQRSLRIAAREHAIMVAMS